MNGQSVKTTGVGGEQRGYDGAKKIKGRKRHLLVDTQGSVLEVRVHSAEIQDLKKASSSCSSPPRPIASRASRTCGWTPLYTGQDKGAGWVERTLGWSAELGEPLRPALEGPQAGALLRERSAFEELAGGFVDSGYGDRRLEWGSTPIRTFMDVHLRFGRTSVPPAFAKDIPTTSCRAHTSFEPLRPPRAPVGRRPRTGQPNLRATGSPRAIPV